MTTKNDAKDSKATSRKDQLLREIEKVLANAKKKPKK